MKTTSDCWIWTYTGKRFDILEPTFDQFDIEDIAVSLSRIPRFNGHTELPYTVAEHSVIISTLVPREYQFMALMHEVTEPYMGDMNRPLKNYCLYYKAIEDWLERTGFLAFSISYNFPEVVREADYRLCRTEYEQLFIHKPPLRGTTFYGLKPYDIKIEPVDSWRIAKDQFLDRYHELIGATVSQHATSTV